MTRPKGIHIIPAALLLAASVLPAQDPGIPAYQDLQFPPLPQVELPDVETATLPNGMKVYLLEDHELPLIGGSALIRTGNLFDPPDKVGLAGVTGSVMRTGGTKEKTGDELDVQLENIAASVEASIGETSGSVSFNCLTENLDEVLAVFKEVLTAPEFRQDKLELEKTQLRSLISRQNDDAGSIASREFAELIYGDDNPYAWEMTYEHVDNITRDDLIAFHERYFFPANVILAVRGDFEPGEMKARLERLFAGWTVEQPPAPPFPEVSAEPNPGVSYAVKEDVNQAFLRIGHLGGMLKDEDYPALSVMSDILGGGFASRLFKRIRTELGYAYGISSSWGANYNHPGIFRISGSTKSASATETIEEVLKEVERIQTSDVTDEELNTAKDAVMNSFVFNFDSPAKTLNRIVRYAYFGYPEDFIFQYQKGVQAVTKADVQRVAKEHLKPENFAILVVGNPDDFGTPLTALNKPVKEIDITIPEPKREMSRVDDASLAEGLQMLAKLQEAVGGAAALAAVNDYSQVATVLMQTPQGEMKVSQTNQVIVPSTFRQEMVAPFGQMTSFYDGETGWLKTPQGTQPMPPPVVKQVESHLMRSPFRLWLADRHEGWTVNAAAGNVLEISNGGGLAVELELEPGSGMPAKLRYQSIQMTGAPATLEDTFSDWREVDGVMLPFKVTITREGNPYADLAVQEYEVNAGLTAGELGKQ